MYAETWIVRAAQLTALRRVLIMAMSIVILAGMAMGDGTNGQNVVATHTARQGLRIGLKGDQQARSQALQRAVEIDPDCELARWHLGELRVEGQWRGIADAAPNVAAQLHYAEYQALRNEALAEPGRELALADWCAEKRLKAAERMHLYRVLQSTSDFAVRRQCIRRLGLRMYEGMLLPPEEIQALEKQQTIYQQQLVNWSATLEDWANELINGRAQKKQFVRKQMQKAVDVTAIPALEQIFAPRSAPLALEFVALLGDMDDHEATIALVGQSLDSTWLPVRDAATRQLKNRPVYDYVPLLLQRLESPFQTQYRVGVGLDGLVRHMHLFYREGRDANHLLQAGYIGGPIFVPTERRISGARTSKEGRARLAAAQEERAQRIRYAQYVQQMVALREMGRAAQIEQQVAQANRAIALSNEPVYGVLEATTSQTKLAHAPEVWWDWWQDYNESYQGEKITYTNQVGQFDPCYVPWLHITTMSCFPAGTPVQTLDGMIHVEDIRVGDRVLSQDVETGELAYKLVLQTTTRPPSELLTIGIGEVTVTTTKGHPFWVNGVGWKMAKHLQIGEPVQTLEGSKTIDNIQPSAPAKAYNLVVADFHTYFVGDAELLVHDNTYRQPTRAVTPGLIASKQSSR